MNAVFTFILLLFLVQSLFLELKKTLLFSRKFCFSSPVFCIVQHTRPHVIINHTYIHTHWVMYKQTSLHTFIHAFTVGHARTPVFWVCMVNMLKNQILADMSVYIDDKVAVAPLEKSCSFHGRTYLRSAGSGTNKDTCSITTCSWSCVFHALLQVVGNNQLFQQKLLRIGEKNPQKTIKRLSHD